MPNDKLEAVTECLTQREYIHGMKRRGCTATSCVICNILSRLLESPI